MAPESGVDARNSGLGPSQSPQNTGVNPTNKPLPAEPQHSSNTTFNKPSQPRNYTTLNSDGHAHVSGPGQSLSNNVQSPEGSSETGADLEVTSSSSSSNTVHATVESPHSYQIEHNGNQQGAAGTARSLQPNFHSVPRNESQVHNEFTESRWPTQEKSMQQPPNNPFMASFENQRQPTRRDARFQQTINRLLQDSWFPEIISWIFSAACLISVIVILVAFNKKPLPEWPYNITLNTLVTLFVTLTTTALMVPVSQGISQLKWIWFVDHNWQALDMETFDKASRGAYGSMSLIWAQTRKSASSLGAVITILVLAANAVTQQTVDYVSVLVNDPLEGSATLPRATYYHIGNYLSNPTGGGIFNEFSYDTVSLQSEGEIQAGALAGNNAYPPLRPACSTGNCTWHDYTTLGVCASVANLTDRLSIKCQSSPSLDGCEATFPGVFPPMQILRQPAVIRMQYAGLAKPKIAKPLHFNNVSSVAFKGTEENTLADVLVIWDAPILNLTYLNQSNHYAGIQAAEINLRYCVQSLKTGVERGVPWTVEKNTYDQFEPVYANRHQSLVDYNWTATVPDSQERLKIASYMLLALPKSMYNLFKSQGKYNYFPGGNTPNGVFNYDGVSPIHSVAMQGIINAVLTPPYNTEGLEMFARNLATGVTNGMRTVGNGTSSVQGEALSIQTHVKVAWPWITLLIVVDIASLVFLVLVIIINNRKGCHLWKSSNIALMQALDPESRPRDMVGMMDNRTLQRKAQTLEINLKKQGEIWKLSH